MFQSSKERFRAWLTRFDDILADHPAEVPDDDERLAHHPHRRPLRWSASAGPAASLPARPTASLRCARLRSRRAATSRRRA